MFEAVGEGHKIMQEGPKQEIDLDELERLAAQATPGPWHTEYTKLGDGFYGQLVFDAQGETIAQLAWHRKPKKNGVVGTDREENAAYIVAACNAMPELIAENCTLRERVQELKIHKRTLACRLSKAVLHPVQEERSIDEWIKMAEQAAKKAGE